jgi:transcriptional regulator with XRE-family HTH domain
MEKHRKTRDAASDALVALRKAMGKTQQTFAVEVLKTAITTIARYESSNPPPRGEVLLRLRDIAVQHGFHELASRFELLFVEDITGKLAYRLTRFPATETRPAYGIGILRLEGERALSSMYDYQKILGELNSPDPATKQNAVSTLSALHRGARKTVEPSDALHDAFFPVNWNAQVQVAQPKSSAKKTKRSK